jgi:hypothetical protein
LVLLLAGFAGQLLADVSVTDRGVLLRQHGRQAKQAAKSLQSSQRHKSALGSMHTMATGSYALIDAAGLKYFINTNITFNTTSSASGAASEASYTQAVSASTLNGGSPTRPLATPSTVTTRSASRSTTPWPRA